MAVKPVLIDVKAKNSAGPVLNQLNNQLKRTEKQGKAVERQFRIVRGGMGQMGHQVQDIAVMLQSGQNPFIIIGQQGSQIASLFGPQGAVVGAFLAVGAAIATSMLPSLFKTSQAMKDANEQSKRLFESFDELDGKLRDIALRQAANEIKELEQGIADSGVGFVTYAKTIFAATLGLRSMLGAQQELAAAALRVSDVNEKARSMIVDIKKKTDDRTDATESLMEKLEEELATIGMTNVQLAMYNAKQAGATQADIARAGAIQGLIDSKQQELDLEKQIEKLTLEKDKRAKKDAERKQKELSRTKESLSKNITQIKDSMLQEEELIATQYNRQREIIKQAFDLRVIDRTQFIELMAALNADEDAKMAERFAEQEAKLQSHMEKETQIRQRAADEARRIEEAKQRVQDQALAGAEGLAGQMATLFGKQTAAGKAAFAVQKALAVAQILVDTERAAIAAGAQASSVGGIAGFLASAQGIRAVGYASAAMVAAQAVASFEGGGFTGRGSRSGGLDGKGGFAAILHPNETVIDHTKGQAANGVVVNQTINVTTGVQSTVRAEIVQLMPQIAEAAKGAVADARVRGGNFSRAMVGA
jgi:hypothetical protein